MLGRGANRPLQQPASTAVTSWPICSITCLVPHPAGAITVEVVVNMLELGPQQTIAAASEHCGDKLADLLYYMFGGKGYKEGEAAIARFQDFVAGIYDLVRALASCILWTWKH
jgi:hypothetical protein